jgi:hypothetical protein
MSATSSSSEVALWSGLFLLPDFHLCNCTVLRCWEDWADSPGVSPGPSDPSHSSNALPHLTTFICLTKVRCPGVIIHENSCCLVLFTHRVSVSFFVQVCDVLESLQQCTRIYLGIRDRRIVSILALTMRTGTILFKISLLPQSCLRTPFPDSQKICLVVLDQH